MNYYIKSDSALVTQIEKDTFILDLNSDKYLKLNSSAAAILRIIETNKKTFQEILSELTLKFGSNKNIKDETSEFLTLLESMDLIKATNAKERT
tara:strand:- start:272 stop:553 length:282 start_codon:yes stop_codon:yes gene_type:complete